ncbi:MAG: glycosyltransferase family 4 protein [Pirellulales bacterium]
MATAVRVRGEDLVLIPTFTPLRTDEENVSQQRLFFGGLNVYLQEKSALFRRTPWFFDKLLDSPRLLNWLTKKSGSTKASDLGALTVSTLRGEHGRQSKELRKLLDWLADDFRPDLVHISNALLVGIAGPIRRRLNVPVVCGLMGEDIFLEELPEPHYGEARALLREKSRDVDAFVALNRYYGEMMSEYLDVPPAKIEVIRHGLNLAGHSPRVRPEPRSEIVIGYFGRIAPEKGLHLLLEAFALLCGESGLPPLRLRAAGYMSALDVPYWERLLARTKELGLEDRVEYVGEVDRAGKIAFLQSLDIFAEPTVYRESKGLAVLEAWANGLPAVLPRHGTFPEYIEETGGGVLHEPESPPALVAAMRPLILDPRQGDELGRAGAAVVRERFTADVMAERHLELYRRLVEKPVAVRA